MVLGLTRLEDWRGCLLDRRRPMWPEAYSAINP